MSSLIYFVVMLVIRVIISILMLPLMIFLGAVYGLLPLILGLYYKKKALAWGGFAAAIAVYVLTGSKLILLGVCILFTLLIILIKPKENK